MTALVLLLATFGQSSYGELAPCYQPPRLYCWYVPYRSPWNITVDNLRATKAAQPKALPTSEEWSHLEMIASVVDEAKEALYAAPRDQKAILREEYYETKRQLENARLKVCRDMQRRRRHGIQ